MIVFSRESYANAIAEIAPHIPSHFAEVYGQTIGKLDDAAYQQIEANHDLVLIIGRDNGKLISYISAFLKRDMHSQGRLISYVDMYYLLPAYRKGWTGFHLVKAMEDELRRIGVKKIYASGLKSTNTSGLFKYGKYKEEETIYSKML